MRLAASQLPAIAPCVRTASAAYWEQVGVKRQPAWGPNNTPCIGDTVQRYTRTSASNVNCAGFIRP